MINDARDNVIRMTFFNEPKIEYHNNSRGIPIYYVYVCVGIIEWRTYDGANKALLITILYYNNIHII